MRYLYILALLSLNNIAFTQTVQFFSLGQTVPASKNNCLVIKSNSKSLKKLPALAAGYQSITAVKLAGFNAHDGALDTVLYELKQLSGLRELIFENCDLSAIEGSFAGHHSLEKISIIKNSVVFENTFFPLLKNNAIKKLCIQTDDADIITDSIGLLTHLTFVQVSSNSLFSKSNFTKTIQINNDKNALQSIEMAYFGDFYKPDVTKVRSIKTSNVPKAESLSKTKMDCIKQPIPGIDINDTAFNLNPLQKSSFTYQSGTTLSVDANAFQTQNGQPYTGTVKLFYREFRNPVEIMLSGIPMTSTANGETRLFKSGGMYELNAYDGNNKPLKLMNDTAVKINFALTDTSNTFKFYSLNNDGSWDTEKDSVIIVKPDSSANPSIAVVEYYKYMRTIRKNKADTLNYYSRFDNPEYLYTYRKDNFEKNRKSSNPKDSSFVKKDSYRKKTLTTKALFRVKYVRQTKDKEIIFTIVKAHKTAVIPSYMYTMLNRDYLYQGNLTKEQFKALYSRKLLCWDVRPASMDNTVTLDIKTTRTRLSLSGQIVTLHKDKTYTVQKYSGKLLNQKMARLIRRDGAKFNKKYRYAYFDLNDANYKKNKNVSEYAYKHSWNFQTTSEKTLSFSQWQAYSSKFASSIFNNGMTFENYNQVGNALLKSGLGVKNIDTYLHNGSMQDIYVKYNNISFDTVSTHYSTILFKSINTNYPLMTDHSEQAFNGYYFKNRPNYVIRFSGNNVLQVSKPALTKEMANTITLDYIDQYNVKGMDSNQITKLILD